MLQEQFDGDASGVGNDTCGMGATFGFVEVLSAALSNESMLDPYPLPAFAQVYLPLY